MSGADFADLLADVAQAIEASVPAWRMRLGEAIGRWQAEGIACQVLVHALERPEAPDVEALLARFERAVLRLRALEREAAELDATQAGAACFRDPTKLTDAERLVARLRETAAALAEAAAARARPIPLDPECWVLAWPTVDALLVDDAG